MTPEQQQALNTHVQAIAEILYNDSDPKALQTLEGIEVTIRSQLQKHVSPELGVFYQNRYGQGIRQTPTAEKHPGRFGDHREASPVA